VEMSRRVAPPRSGPEALEDCFVELAGERLEIQAAGIAKRTAELGNGAIDGHPVAQFGPTHLVHRGAVNTLHSEACRKRRLQPAPGDRKRR
jgi:hypothetical protein